MTLLRISVWVPGMRVGTLLRVTWGPGVQIMTALRLCVWGAGALLRVTGAWGIDHDHFRVLRLGAKDAYGRPICVAFSLHFRGRILAFSSYFNCRFLACTSHFSGRFLALSSCSNGKKDLAFFVTSPLSLALPVFRAVHKGKSSQSQLFGTSFGQESAQPWWLGTRASAIVSVRLL